jgi:hypothetical protein
MTIPVPYFLDGIFPWQRDALEVFDSGLSDAADIRIARESGLLPRFLIWEVHRRARKTTLLLNMLIRESCRWPGRSYTYVGPTLREARDIVWDAPLMLKAHLPEDIGWQTNEQKLHVRFANDSLLRFRGADDPDALRGIDTDGVGFDEWSMQKESVWTEIFRPIIAQDPSRWAAFLYTPKGLNHATLMFDRASCVHEGGSLPESGVAEKRLPSWYAVRLTAEHSVKGDGSPIMSLAELALAKEDMPLAMYEQEFLCARITEEECTLITSFLLESCPREIPVSSVCRRIISVDPGFTGDACVMGAFDETKLREKRVFRSMRKTQEVVGQALIFSNQTGIDSFIVDYNGNGKGVGDGLAEAGKNVQFFMSQSAASANDDYANLRAEAWWHAYREVESGRVEYPSDSEVRRQIPFASRYKPDARRQQMAPKGDIRKLLSRSPDDAEMWMMGIYGLQQVDETVDAGYGEDDVSIGVTDLLEVA